MNKGLTVNGPANISTGGMVVSTGGVTIMSQGLTVTGGLTVLSGGLYVTGGMTINGVAYIQNVQVLPTPSDRRLKTDVQQLQASLSKVSRMKGIDLLHQSYLVPLS